MRKFLTDSLRRFRGKAPKEQVEGKSFLLKVATEPEIVPLKFDSFDLEPLEDYRANLNLYHEALENIRAKYRPRVLKAFYVNGEELLSTEAARNDFCQKVGLRSEELEKKILNYCQKNKIPYEEMYLQKPLEDIDPELKAELEQLIAAEIYIEKTKFSLRDDNFLADSLQESVALAIKVKRSDEEIAALQKAAAEVQEKGVGLFLKHKVKGKMNHTLLEDLARDVNPLGERREYTESASNWQKKLDLFVERLMRKGVYLNQKLEGSLVFEPEIMATWDEVNESVKAEVEQKRSFERVLEAVLKKHPQINLEYRAAIHDEQTKSDKTSQPAKTVKEDSKVSPQQKMAEIKLQQEKARKNKQIKTPGLDERNF